MLIGVALESRYVRLSSRVLAVVHERVQCLLYLYIFKMWHPNRVFLIRGNHECQHLTTYFTFRRECESIHAVTDPALT